MTLDEGLEREGFVPTCLLKSGKPDVFVYFEEFHCHRLDVVCPYRDTISLKIPSYKPDQPYTFVAAYCTFLDKEEKKG